jgi:hypothetical protein
VGGLVVLNNEINRDARSRKRRQAPEHFSSHDYGVLGTVHDRVQYFPEAAEAA